MITITVRLPIIKPTNNEYYEDFIYHYEADELRRKKLRKDNKCILNLIDRYIINGNNLTLEYPSYNITYYNTTFWISDHG